MKIRARPSNLLVELRIGGRDAPLLPKQNTSLIIPRVTRAAVDGTFTHRALDEAQPRVLL